MEAYAVGRKSRAFTEVIFAALNTGIPTGISNQPINRLGAQN